MFVKHRNVGVCAPNAVFFVRRICQNNLHFQIVSFTISIYIYSEYILQCVGLSAQEDAGHFMYCFSIFGTICIFKRAVCKL